MVITTGAFDLHQLLRFCYFPNDFCWYYMTLHKTDLLDILYFKITQSATALSYFHRSKGAHGKQRILIESCLIQERLSLYKEKFNKENGNYKSVKIAIYAAENSLAFLHSQGVIPNIGSINTCRRIGNGF